MINFNALVVILIVGTVAGTFMFASDTNEMVGTYESESGSLLELHADGRFTVTQEYSFSGDYTYDEESLTLIYAYGSFVLDRDGTDLIDKDGERWMKK